MSSKNIKRLSELGIAPEDSEIELLREENINLKKQLEEARIENDILRKNFAEAIKNIIESTRNLQPNEQIIYPYVDGTAIDNGRIWSIGGSTDNRVQFLNNSIQELDFNYSMIYNYENHCSALNICEVGL